MEWKQPQLTVNHICVFVYSSGKGGNGETTERSFILSAIFAILMAVKEKYYKQKTGNQQTHKKPYHKKVVIGGLRKKKKSMREQDTDTWQYSFDAFLFLDALSPCGSVNITCRRGEKHHLQTVMNLKWKQATQLAQQSFKIAHQEHSQVTNTFKANKPNRN